MKLFLLGLALTVGPSSVAADWQSLVGNSPFGQGAAAVPATTPEDLEFRGVVQEEDRYLINLYNPATHTSQWIPVQGRAPGLEVRSYDARLDKVQIIQNGRALTLPLKQNRITLMQPTPAADGTKPKGEASGDDMGKDAGRDEARGVPPGAFRNLPPEAQAMIQEFRRRRAERGAQQTAPRPRQQ